MTMTSVTTLKGVNVFLFSKQKKANNNNNNN